MTSAGTGAGAGWWKLRAIQDDVEATSPESAAWIDDQLAFETEDQSWTRLLGRRFLAVSPDPRRGISPAELEQIRWFLGRRVF